MRGEKKGDQVKPESVFKSGELSCLQAYSFLARRDDYNWRRCSFIFFKKNKTKKKKKKEQGIRYQQKQKKCLRQVIMDHVPGLMQRNALHLHVNNLETVMQHDSAYQHKLTPRMLPDIPLASVVL